MKTFDWIIVGGGIAGISLSEILTREGHSVALIEKENKLASATTREFHEWFHTGSLYTLLKDDMKTLKYILGSLDDLLEFYSSFSQMNLRPTENGLKITDAFKCFMGTNLDILVCENFILHKEKQDINLRESYKNKFNLD